jgi:hypothetical protein
MLFTIAPKKGISLMFLAAARVKLPIDRHRGWRACRHRAPVNAETIKGKIIRLRQ